MLNYLCYLSLGANAAMLLIAVYAHDWHLAGLTLTSAAVAAVGLVAAQYQGGSQ